MPLQWEWRKKWKLSFGCVYLITVIILDVSLRIADVIVTDRLLVLLLESSSDGDFFWLWLVEW